MLYLSVFFPTMCFIVAHVLWQKIFNHLIETQPSIIRPNNPCPFSTFNDHIKTILHIVVKVVLNFSKLDIYVFFACQRLFSRYLFAWVMIYYLLNSMRKLGINWSLNQMYKYYSNEHRLTQNLSNTYYSTQSYFKM